MHEAEHRAAAALFIAATLSTFFCTAVNAYTLRVAYPLWRYVPPESFAALHAAYLRLLGPVITFPHIVMFFSTAALIWRRPAEFGLAQAWLVFGCAAAVVLLSAGVGGTVHGRFTRFGFDEEGMRQLIVLSWARTLLMLAASGLLCRVLWKALAG